MNLKETDLFWTAIITILSVAYPILFQVISQLEEKYSSDHIVELFKKEMVNKCFKREFFFNGTNTMETFKFPCIGYFSLIHTYKREYQNQIKRILKT